jgi:hypothetical protein
MAWMWYRKPELSRGAVVWVLHGASVVYISVRYHGLGFRALSCYSLAAIFACSGDIVGRYSLERSATG